MSFSALSSIHTISLFVLSLNPHYYILYVNQGRKKLIENLDIVPDCLSGAAMPLKSHVLASDLSIFFTSSKQLMFSARKLTANEWSLRWILWTGRQGCFRPCQTYNLLLAYNPSREPPRAQKHEVKALSLICLTKTTQLPKKSMGGKTDRNN